MPELISDTARRIAEAGTPVSCTGCPYSFMRAIYLSGRVEAGDLTEAETVQELNDELTENCRFGHLRKRLGRDCMYGVNSVELGAPAQPKPRNSFRPWE